MYMNKAVKAYQLFSLLNSSRLRCLKKFFMEIKYCKKLQNCKTLLSRLR